jgi:TatD DNase family protein
MLIDTHCHLDADEFAADRDAVVARARAAGVTLMVLPAAHVEHFAQTAAVARQYGCAYALGIHPLWVERSRDDDIGALRAAVAAAMNDPRFVAIGEIGLDFYVPGGDSARHVWFYREQLKVAHDFGLPTILHVRRSQDALLKYLRLHPVAGGIAHAFNGSDDQARRFVKAGFRLGFGGAMTYDGSLRIRRLAATVPADAWVIETDAPDIPPQWLRQAGATLRNEPAELARIAATMAQLRGVTVDTVAEQNRRNACAALPRLAHWLAATVQAPSAAEAR